jgi:5-methylcytosine-specific restriction endonuclease McrA
MSERPPPSAPFQLRFLQDLQRIFDEGSFTASYKFALLQAIADLAVLHGNDTGDELTLSTRALAERIVELYWRQVTPWDWADEGDAVVLRQITQKSAAILRNVAEVSAEYGGSLARARSHFKEWRRLVGRVDRTVRLMPLWKLQVVGGEPNPFLYDHGEEERVTEITLHPGVAYCLRAFHPLISELVQSRWARFVQERNPDQFAGHRELREFLFGSTREALTHLVAPLMEVQYGQCLYCEKLIRGQPHVDHFVPWSRYPSNLGHNLVLAHEACNARKSDHIAASEHLERWVRRNTDRAYALVREFDAAGAEHDLGTSREVVRWAYRQIERRQGRVWQRGSDFVPLDPGWERWLAR